MKATSFNYLNNNFVPEKMVKIDNTQLEIKAALEFRNMQKEAQKQKLNIIAISGYRIYELYKVFGYS